MSAVAIGSIVFAAVFGGALLGTLFHVLVARHLNSDTRDVIKLGMGLIGTMAALVLGLLISSAKASYETHAAEVSRLTSDVMLLDRLLAHYGAETKEARDQLRRAVVLTVGHLWPDERPRPEPSPDGGLDELHRRIQALSPRNDAHLGLRTQALGIVSNITQTRWRLVAQGERTVPMPFLVVLVLWLTVILMSFGLFVRFNPTVVTALLVCALAFASAIFLVLELDRPFDGVIQISSTPLRQILLHLGR